MLLLLVQRLGKDLGAFRYQTAINEEAVEVLWRCCGHNGSEGVVKAYLRATGSS